MAKTPFTIWLKNLVPGVIQKYPGPFGEGDMWEVGTILSAYFTQVCSQTSKYSIPQCSWQPRMQGVQDEELLVYFLPSQAASVVATQTNQPLGQSGATFPAAGGVISEVYVDVIASQGDPQFGRLVANLVFHELMHNKLDAYISGGPLQDIHVQGGGGLARGGPKAAALTSADRPNPKNISLMAQNLDKIHPQFKRSLSTKSPYP